MDLTFEEALLSVRVHQRTPTSLILTLAWRGERCASIETALAFEGKPPAALLSPRVVARPFACDTPTPLYTKRATCVLHGREIDLIFEDRTLRLHLSAQGFAFRWITAFTSRVKLRHETFSLKPPRSATFLYAYHNHPHHEDPFQNSWESIHHATPWEAIEAERLIYLPLTFMTPSVAISLSECELIDAPGLNLKKSARAHRFEALQACAPKTVDVSNQRYGFVTERFPYLVETDGARPYPWRLFMMADTPAKLYENDLPYLLSSPPQHDFSWVQPGRVAWEWWNAWGLEDVPFTPGVNTATYKVYIDFASSFHIPYVILDEGWAENLDISRIRPEIDLPELIRYGEARGVRLILWSAWPQLIDRQEHFFRHYASMGIAGFKIDFFDRDDCAIAAMLATTARVAEKYHLVLAYHGIHKPTGLSRTMPHVLTYEGVFGLENTKWTDQSVNFVANDVRLAFARLLAGPMDYTPGAMTNRHREAYQKDFYHPMSMGTRCHQAAMFVLYDTALQMLCDSPSAYLKEVRYTHFLTAIPLMWDETIALPYSHPETCLAVLRRKGERWFFAVLNNDEARIITLPVHYLPAKNYLATALVDGIDVATNAQSYTFEERFLTLPETMDLYLAPGGGCVVSLQPIEANEAVQRSAQ